MLDSGTLSFGISAALFFYYQSIVTKCMPIWLLALRCIQLPVTVVPDKTIGWGLAVSSLGDAALYIESEWLGHDPKLKEGFFLIGLLAFLIGHVLYAKAFLQHTSKHKKEMCIPLLAYYTFMMQTILPEAPADLHIPIMVYGVIISVMGYAAINFYIQCVNPVWKANALKGLIGAFFFIVSDSILAIAKFSPKNAVIFGNNAELYIMLTYYLGQYLIAGSSIMVESDQKKA